MTVTDELRRLLDERGVERFDYVFSGSDTTTFRVRGIYLTFTPMRDGLVCSTILTPEQAVEATLGRGTCKVKHSIVDEVGGGELDRWVCGECGHIWWSIEDAPSCCPRCGREVVE